MKILLLILIFPILAFSQKSDSLKQAYNSKITFGKIPNKIEFETLKSNEIELEKKSILKNEKQAEKFADSIKIKYTEEIKDWLENSKYSNNRSRILWGKLKRKKTEVSLPCKCTKKTDTLTISSAFGFFGGAGVIIKIKNNEFYSQFFEYLDEPIYKQNKDDEKFVKSIIVGAKFQRLILENKPIYNELLTGYLTFLSKPYYTESAKNTEFENFTEIEMHFKCLIMKEY